MSDTRKRPWAADNGHEDYVNWIRWFYRQPEGPSIIHGITLGNARSLYAIMCRLADGEGKA